MPSTYIDKTVTLPVLGSAGVWEFRNDENESWGEMRFPSYLGGGPISYGSAQIAVCDAHMFNPSWKGKFQMRHRDAKFLGVWQVEHGVIVGRIKVL